MKDRLYRVKFNFSMWESSMTAAFFQLRTIYPSACASTGVESVPTAPEAADLKKATKLWDYCSDLAGLSS